MRTGTTEPSDRDNRAGTGRKRPLLPFSPGCCFCGERGTHFRGNDEARLPVPLPRATHLPSCKLHPIPHPQTWPRTPAPALHASCQCTDHTDTLPEAPEAHPLHPAECPQAPMSPSQAHGGEPGWFHAGSHPCSKPAPATSRHLHAKAGTVRSWRQGLSEGLHSGWKVKGTRTQLTGGNECVLFFPSLLRPQTR